MASIGEELQRERHRRGLTLHDAEEVLHIKAAYLEALEQDNYGVIPGAVYVKGFISNYAEFLGLDKQRLVDAYKASNGETIGVPLRRMQPRKLRAHEDVEHKPEMIKPTPQRLPYTTRRERRKKVMAQERITVAVIAVLVIIFLLWLFIF